MYLWYYFFFITSNVSIFFEIPKISVFGGFLIVRKSPNNLNLATEFISIRNTCENDISVFLGEKGFCRYQPNYQSRFGVGLFRKAQKILQGHCQYLFFERVPCLLVLYGSSNSIPRKS